MLDLGPATRTVADVIAKVREDQLGDPTPCPAYTVGDLLDHLNGLCHAFTQAALKDPVDGSGTGDGSRLPDDWRESIPRRLDALAESWRAPEAWTGDTAAGGVDLDGNTAGQVATNEVVVHGWDLAVATGQTYDMDEVSIAGATAFVALFSGPGTEDMRGDGAFGPEVEPPADATPLQRLIAMNGRDPHWVP